MLHISDWTGPLTTFFGGWSAGGVKRRVFNEGNLNPVTFQADRTNWASRSVLGNVAGQLAWRNYGNNHTIFDASASLSPDGTAVDRSNAQYAWTAANCPTLMGWNGANTYGVRVDSARIADNVQGYTLNTGAYGNTIVLRDGNGYGYFTYVNCNRGNETSAAASYIYDSGDGWLRKKTLQNVKYELVSRGTGDPWGGTDGDMYIKYV